MATTISSSIPTEGSSSPRCRREVFSGPAPTTHLSSQQQDNLMALLQSLTQRMSAAEGMAQETQKEIGAVKIENTALKQQVEAQAQENSALRTQNQQQGAQIEELAKRVEAVRAENGTLRADSTKQAAAAAARAKEDTLQRQRVEAELRKQGMAREKAELEKERAFLQAELSKINSQQEMSTGVATGATGLGGAFWGFVAAGPAGAIAGALGGGAFGNKVVATDIAKKDDLRRNQIVTQLRQISQRLTVLK